MSICRYSLLVLALAPGLLRAGLETRLMTDDPGGRMSGECRIMIAATNTGNDVIAPDLPETVDARIGSATVSLRRVGGEPGRLNPGETVFVHYRGPLPGSEDGLVGVELMGLDAGRCFAEITPSVRGKADGTDSDQSESPTSSSSYHRRYADNLSFYEPMYIVAGPQVSWNAKIQLSFKYRMLSEEGRLAEGRPFWEDLFFGYTQTSVWDLGVESAPFLDTSYKPGFFYYDRYNNARILGMALDSFEGGYRHESNGQGGEKSRSLNTLYVRPTFRVGRLDGWHLTIAPKIWAYVGDLSDNPDVADYHGYFDLDLRFGRSDGLQVAALLRKGTDSDSGSIQIDLTYPLDRLFFGNAASYVQLQIFEGWSETLLFYDQKLPTQVRLGFGLSR